MIAAASLLAASAQAQPAGDPTPDTLAPLVVIVNPMDGAAVRGQIRLQARVHHPLGIAELSSVSVSISGEGGSTIPLSLNPRYGLGDERGIFEATARLGPGSHALVATAVDSAGRSTRSVTVTVSVNRATGDGNLLVRDNSSQLCSDCHGTRDHGSETAGRTFGAWTTTCRDCHTPHSTRNLGLIRETIKPPWFAGAEPASPRTVRLSRRSGYSDVGGVARPDAASFANADGSGPCQVCHERTVRWRRAGGADSVHLGDCGFCHRHGTGFKSVCTDCHGVPPPTGAHAAHRGASAPSPTFPSDPRPLGCGSCHPTDPSRHGDGTSQVELNAGLVLPGGTTTAGAQLSGDPAGPTCLVACHFPMGASASPVTWNAGGPLPCTSCHSRIDPIGAPPTPRAGPSLHDPGFSEARPASGEPTTCLSCHDAGAHDANHLTGGPGLAASGDVDAACIACHSPPSGPALGPQGQVLHRGADAATAQTPPILPGWSRTAVDAASGDFHGGRRGTCFGAYGPSPCSPTATPTGYGGTLKAPYYRGYPAMTCATCHAGHVSGNAFLFAPVVNGTPIPAGTIDRTGVGAERLCEACHAGGRHDRCKSCHTDAYYCDSGQCWMDGPNHIDPAPPGSACFFCHGHEGIVKWTSPYGPHGNAPTDCNHCHGGLFNHGDTPPQTVPPDLTPPALPYGPPTVSFVTASSAVVAWRTSERATTFVEYGVGFPGYVAGTATEDWNHSLTLTGLAAGTTYVWRIRSTDAQRNVLRTALGSFTTTAAGAVPYPDIVPVIAAGVPSPQTTNTVNLTWFPVTAPSGNPVEYRVQFAEDEAFTTLVNGSPPDSGWIQGTSTTSGGRAALFFQVAVTNLPIDQCTEEIPYNQYYWRVKARDSVTGTESDWSPVNPFGATSYDPWGC